MFFDGYPWHSDRPRLAPGVGIALAAVDQADEPASLAEAKPQCRVDAAFTGDDNLILALIPAARELAEKHTGRLLAPRTATITLPGFPHEPIRLPIEPVTAVTAVRYRGTDGTLTTLSPSAYQTALAYSPPLIAPVPQTVWPWTQWGELAQVEIDVTCGAAAPPTARQAILMTVAYWYAFRGDNGDTEKMGLPMGAIRLLNLLDTGSYR